ncbi:MAG: hypothetical protein PHH37_08255 [Paludibacter sp.]|nr:hypothetical protein [Paludibacter sp.]
MDIVYLFRGGSTSELLFSLKSVHQFVTGFDSIFVVGTVVNIPFVKNIVKEYNTGNRYLNVYSKLEDVCNNEDISNDFLLMNDDFIFTKSIDLLKYKTKYLSDLTYNSNDNRSTLFGNTIGYLTENNLTTHNFDVHAPMIFNKNNFLRMPCSKDSYMYSFRSLYGNIYFDNDKMEEITEDFVCHSPSMLNDKINSEDEIVGTTDLLLFKHRAEVENLLNKLFTPKIYISLTSTPARQNYIQDFILILKKQTFPFEKIILNIPTVYKNSDEIFSVPDAVLNDEAVYINFIDEDLGPISKIAPVSNLDFIKGNDYILSVDDDIDYPANMLVEFVKDAFTGKDRCISGKTIGVVDGKVIYDGYGNNKYIEGFSGVLYKKYFLEKIYTFIFKFKENEDCYRSDDITLSEFLRNNNVAIEKIRSMSYNAQKFASEGRILNYGTEEDALHADDIGKRYSNAIEYLKTLN